MITFSTCWYKIKSKFDETIYKNWMKNILLNVNNCYFVVYTDEKSKLIFDDMSYPRSNVLIVVKELNELYNYRYRENWIENHEKNTDLNAKTSWELNMLWSEKISFVKNTKEANPFNTEWFGWCDIGYFRNGMEEIKDWPNHSKILDKTKLHYSNVCRDPKYIENLYKTINNKDNQGLPIVPIPTHIATIAGGFFISHKGCINEWFLDYDRVLKIYFDNKQLVKDDQIIIQYLYYSNPKNFKIYIENKPGLDNWFMFKRILK
jgi:hypothetical protein